MSTTELPDQIVVVGVKKIVAVDAEKIVAVDANFDTPTRLKNEYDRNEEENESVVELFSV